MEFFEEGSGLRQTSLQLAQNLKEISNYQSSQINSLKGYNFKISALKSKFQIFRKEYSQFSEKQKKLEHYTTKIQTLEKRKDTKERKAEKLSRKEIKKITRVNFVF